MRELWLHLYLNAFKNERSAFLRERVGGRGSAPPEDWGWIDVRKLVLRAGDACPVDVWPTAELRRPGDDDETDARVPLPRAIAPGEAVELDVVVRRQAAHRRRAHRLPRAPSTWSASGSRRSRASSPTARWAHFPFHHLAEFYADYGTYDVTLDVPAGVRPRRDGPGGRGHVAGGRRGRAARAERRARLRVDGVGPAGRLRTRRIDGVDVTLLYPRGFMRAGRARLAAAALRAAVLLGALRALPVHAS